MVDVTLSRRLQTDLRTAWRAWTDAQQVEAWLWPFPTTATVDVRVGGTWRVASESPALAAGGPVTVVEQQERMEFDWRWDGDDHTSHVTVELRPSTDGGVDCTVTHRDNRTDTEARNHEEGWSDCLDRLVQRIG